jgi:hypothetical protein
MFAQPSTYFIVQFLLLILIIKKEVSKKIMCGQVVKNFREFSRLENIIESHFKSFAKWFSELFIAHSTQLPHPFLCSSKCFLFRFDEFFSVHLSDHVVFIVLWNFHFFYSLSTYAV